MLFLRSKVVTIPDTALTFYFDNNYDNCNDKLQQKSSDESSHMYCLSRRCHVHACKHYCTNVKADLWGFGLLGLYTGHEGDAVLSPYAFGSPGMISRGTTSGCNMHGDLLEHSGHAAQTHAEQSVVEGSAEDGTSVSLLVSQLRAMTVYMPE